MEQEQSQLPKEETGEKEVTHSVELTSRDVEYILMQSI